MKQTLVALLLLTFVLPGCKNKVIAPERKIYNEDFKWSITIPKGFDTVSAVTWARMQQRGEEAVEKTYDTQVENKAKTIFVFHSNKVNYFESNYQPFDTITDGNYLEGFAQVNTMLYHTFEENMKGAKMDSVTSTAVVSGLTFNTFHITITMPNKMVMNCYMFSRLFGKKEFSVNIISVERQKEKDLLDAWLHSKFEN